MEPLEGRLYKMNPNRKGEQYKYVVYDPVRSFRTKQAREHRQHLRKDAYTIALWIDEVGPTWLGVGCDSRETATTLLEVHWQGWINLDDMRAELGGRVVDATLLHHYREQWLRTRPKPEKS